MQQLDTRSEIWKFQPWGTDLGEDPHEVFTLLGFNNREDFLYRLIDVNSIGERLSINNPTSNLWVFSKSVC